MFQEGTARPVMNGYILLLSGLFPGDWERFRFPALFLFFRMIWVRFRFVSRKGIRSVALR